MAIAALPTAFSGMIRSRTAFERPWNLPGNTESSGWRRGREGTMLRIRKNSRLITGRKKKATSQAGSPTARKRRRVSTTPTQMNGSAIASMVIRKTASEWGREANRIALVGGIQ